MLGIFSPRCYRTADQRVGLPQHSTNIIVYFSRAHAVHGIREDDGTLLRGTPDDACCGCHCAQRPATAVDSTTKRAALRSDAKLPGTRSVAANHRRIKKKRAPDTSIRRE